MLVLGIKAMGKSYGEKIWGKIMPLVHDAFPYHSPIVFPYPKTWHDNCIRLFFTDYPKTLGTILVWKTWHENCCRFFLTKKF